MLNPVKYKINPKKWKRSVAQKRSKAGLPCNKKCRLQYRYLFTEKARDEIPIK